MTFRSGKTSAYYLWRPKSATFPIGTLVLGQMVTRPTLDGYTNYSMEAYLRGTTTAITNGARVNAQGSIGTDTRGAHTGVSRVTGAGTGAGTFSDNTGNSAGNHQHTTGFLSESNQLLLATINFVAMQMTTAQPFLPTHSVFTNNGYFSATTYHNDAEFISGNANPYIYIGNTWSTAETAPVSSTGLISTATGSGGAHVHHNASRNAFATGGAVNGFMISAGLHTHGITARFNQSAAASTKRLNLQLSRAASSTQRGPKSGMIMPYVGAVANIPAPWFLCDGNNGTVAMNNFFLAGRTVSGISNVFNGTLGSDLTITDASQSSPTWSHNHYSTANLAGNGIAGFHATFDASHTHNLTTFVDVVHVPPFRSLFFIQYMG